MENLTKENFFNNLTEKYPLAMKDFCTWIDKYKKENNWTELFNQGVTTHTVTPKFHDLPLAMQIGILVEYFIAIDDEMTLEEAVQLMKEDTIQQFRKLDYKLYIAKYPQYAGTYKEV